MRAAAGSRAQQRRLRPGAELSRELALKAAMKARRLRDIALIQRASDDADCAVLATALEAELEAVQLRGGRGGGDRAGARRGY